VTGGWVTGAWVTGAWDHHGRTHRLELTDQTLREWDAPVLYKGRGFRRLRVRILD
jgi:hypothetical protein